MRDTEIKKEKMSLKKVVVIGSLVLIANIVFAQPAELELKWEGIKLPPVKFHHAKHSIDYKIECKICHHADPAPEKGVKKCIECHDITQPKDGVLKAMDAYHKTCMDCHKKVNADLGKAAPIKCNDCHKK